MQMLVRCSPERLEEILQSLTIEVGPDLITDIINNHVRIRAGSCPSVFEETILPNLTLEFLDLHIPFQIA